MVHNFLIAFVGVYVCVYLGGCMRVECVCVCKYIIFAWETIDDVMGAIN